MFFYSFRLSAHRLHGMLFFQSCVKTPYVFCGTEDLRKIPRIHRTQSNEISLSISTLGFSFVKIQSVIVMLTHITKARNWSSQRVKKMLMDFSGIISDNFVVLHSFSLRTWRSYYSFLIFNRCFWSSNIQLEIRSRAMWSHLKLYTFTFFNCSIPSITISQHPWRRVRRVKNEWIFYQAILSAGCVLIRLQKKKVEKITNQIKAPRNIVTHSYGKLKLNSWATLHCALRGVR